MGLHINSLLTQHLDFVGKVRPSVNLLLNPKAEEAEKVKARSPESKLIGRVTVPPGDGIVHGWYLDAGTAEGARAAGKRAAELCLAQRVPQCDAWIVNNEPPIKTVEQARLLAEFDSEFARQMSRGGSKACIGAFSRGTPEIPALGSGAILDAYSSALRIAYDVGAWLCFHQYGKYPLLHDAEYLALRWQRHILPYYRAKNVPIPRYVITEYGYDLGSGVDAQDRDGWRVSPYADNPRDYADHLLQLAQEYAKDNACIGATLFCAGFAGWQSFAVDGELLDYMATLIWPKFGTVVAPIPVSVPKPVEVPMPIPAPIKPVSPDGWKPSPNFTPNKGIAKDVIVYHHTAPGDALSWLRNPGSGVSTSYLVMKTGTIYQLVADNNIAWHAGYSRMPDGRENVNNFSFGIEIENDGDGRDPYPQVQIDAVVALSRYLVARYGIKRENNVTHKLIRDLWKKKYPSRLDDLGRPIGYKTDPRGLDMDKLLDRIYAVPLRYDKLVWALEYSARVLRLEGWQAEHDYLIKVILPPLVRLRDGK